jgi:predicted glutamine amidotransferase
VYKPTTAKMPSKRTLQKCWDNNRDGAGYMFPSNGNVVIKKGFMKFKDFYANLQNDLKRYGEFTPFVLHFRIQTQGGVNPQYTHPFPLSADMDDLKKLRVKTDIGIAHNGIIDLTSSLYSKTVTYSDTMKFITDYLTLIIHDKDYYKDIDKLTLIERLIESKMAIMDGDGHTELIGFFIEDNGCYYSNIYYKDSRYTKVEKTPVKTTENKVLTHKDIIDGYGEWIYDEDDNVYYFDPEFFCPKKDFKSESMCKRCDYYQQCKKWGEISC